MSFDMRRRTGDELPRAERRFTAATPRAARPTRRTSSAPERTRTAQAVTVKLGNPPRATAGRAPAAARAASSADRAAGGLLRAVVGGMDLQLIAILGTLLAFGLAMVFSASMYRAQIVYSNSAYFFIRQMAWVGVGLLGMLIMASVPYRFWQRLAIPIMGAALAMLVAVLVFGKELHGAQRTLFSGSFQPSEFAKLAIIIYVAAWVASKKDHLAEVQGGLVPFAVLMGIVAGLIMLEPNFSVTIIILVTGVTMFFVGGGNIRQLGISGLIGAAALGLVIWRSGHGHLRIETWWNSLFDPSLASYDVTQAMTVIRLGHGIDTAQGNYMLKASVPLLWSDYLFANVGSDLGFVGTLSVVILFAALGYRGLGVALNARDQFGALTAIGITTWLLTQALVHIGASLALIPTTGVPLPFMSYGGSSIVASLAAIGLLLSISRASPVKRAPYAHFAFGWWNGRPRVPDPERGQRLAGMDREAPAIKRRRRVVSKRRL